jgi:riboflavin kinase/FMN adenylyltransferase
MVEIINISLDDAVYDFFGKPLAIAIGTFDGVHLGHRKLISAAVTQAKAIDGVAAVYTFRPHPTVITQIYDSKSMLCSFEEKYKILSTFDLINIIEQRFDENFAEMSHYDFVQFLRRKFPTLCEICVGENFRFGHDRLGDVEILVNYAKQFGIQTTIVPPFIMDGKRVSSSTIRELFSIGNIELANAMLGRG